MKPVSRKVMPSSNNLQPTILTPTSVIGSVKGSVKKLGQNYQNATVVLYSKANLQPIAIRKPKENGDYSFMGLTTDMKTFVVAFDANKQFNAVIQDNVVPK
ncbi:MULTISPECIES: hypothetical protein [unclassified Acinetobacter]|uniref:hypothetical protein n=1 Tax=unclassified Acinetobacter TaxID=196816 RepID=UPI00051ACE13|nr:MULTISPECIES: hypothetical protein [unclassified Acinetobacter]